METGRELCHSRGQLSAGRAAFSGRSRAGLLSPLDKPRAEPAWETGLATCVASEGCRLGVWYPKRSLLSLPRPQKSLSFC